MKFIFRKTFHNETFLNLQFICLIDDFIIASDYSARCLHVINSNSYEYIMKISLNGHMGKIKGLCAVKNKYVCAVDSTNAKLYLIEVLYKKYRIINGFNLEKSNNDKHLISYCAIDYNETNNIFYLIVDDKTCKSILMIDYELTCIIKKMVIFQAHNINSLKILNNKVYICHNMGNILIYDSNLEYIGSFGEYRLTRPVFIINHIDKANFIYVYDQQECRFCIFNIHNNEYISYINSTHNLDFAIVYHDTKQFNKSILVSHHKNKYIHIHDISIS